MTKRAVLFISFVLLAQSVKASPASTTEASPPTASAPRKFPSKTSRFFKGVANVMTTNFGQAILVYFPAFSTDPNTGPTYGLMPVVLLKDKKKIVRNIFAPSITHNATFGMTPTLRYYHYPTPNAEFFAIASKSEETNSRASVRYINTKMFDGWLYLRGYVGQETNGAERFFGFGPSSKEAEEANYKIQDREVSLTTGLTLPVHVRLALTNSFHSVEITDGPIDKVKKISQVFPGISGLSDSDIFSQKLSVTYDTRDFLSTPTQGTLAEVFAEFSSRNMGGDFLFQRYGLDYRFLIPRGPDKKYTTAGRFMTDLENGENVPFYTQASLGGDSTLRGYGKMRFIDRGRALFNLEERIRFASMNVFDVGVDFEFTPFLDVGTVFHEYNDINWRDWRPVGGVALRTVVRPSVVGSFDLGFGEDGPALFVGIDYAF